MTRDESINFLNDTKVYVNGKSEEIQKTLFSLDFKWCDDSQKVKKVNCPFLFLHNGRISCGHDMIYFKRCSCREITTEDILNITVNNPKSTYLPFKDSEECWQEMQKHQPIGWITPKKEDYWTVLTDIKKDKDYQLLFNLCTFADGTPFGIKKD